MRNVQVVSLPKAFANSSTKDIKILKTQLPRIIQVGGFHGRFLGKSKSNEEMRGIVNILKSLEDSGLLIKRVTQTIENETKEQDPTRGSKNSQSWV